MSEASKVTEQSDDVWVGLNAAVAMLGNGMTRYKLTRWLISRDLEAKLVAGRQLVTRDSVLALKKKLRKSA